MKSNFRLPLIHFLLLAALLGAAIPARAQKPSPRKGQKVLVISDLEGLDGIVDFNLQCVPFKGPLYPESRKVLAAEVNAAIEGLFNGGATSIVVYDNHYGGHNLSVLDIHEKIPGAVRLLSGGPVSPTLGLDSSYSAIVFIGLHSMAGTKDGVLPHSFTWDIQNIWVNGKKVGEIGARVMLAGELGIPAIMVSGDAAACDEFRELVPNGECATVKWGASHTGGYSLPISDAVKTIKGTAYVAMQHLSSFKPYAVSGPAEVKAQYVSPAVTPAFKPGLGIERIDSETWDFKGKDFISAWLKFRSF
ncbi:MAG: M55 family metallopeptidase [Terriglobia bacterium]